MHKKALPKGSEKLLMRFEKKSSFELAGWVLAGGTGLALQIGHRVSEDFDFFRTDKYQIKRLHETVKEIGTYETLQEDDKTLTVMVSGIKTSFFCVPDPFIFKTIPYRFFSIADIRDIALMKLIAISGRGSKKDFIDLYAILRKKITLQELVGLVPRKYGSGRANIYHILKSLTYFDDAEKEPVPRMLEPFNWNECRNFFIRQSHRMILMV
ncbi:MAG: hypothetical protein A3I75_06085 [Deltaproteobacteria bacterium RIFCSPLOWO2_02_FULL_50_16]|nr:MAG: hypothetical protein A3I75_06085 [Deltaproteobacteria bacterium RIFCSPLOWO2_02_FULL_50_16]